MVFHALTYLDPTTNPIEEFYIARSKFYMERCKNYGETTLIDLTTEADAGLLIVDLTDMTRKHVLACYTV